MNTEHRLPPFRQLSTDRLLVREAHLFEELQPEVLRSRSRRHHAAATVQPRVLFAAALLTVAIAAAPALALSTTLRGIVGLGSTAVEVPFPEFASLADKLRIGMTKSQVRSRIGTPSRVIGACWQYDEHLTVREDTLDAERVCFLDGVYLYRYSKVDGSWNYPGPRGISPIAHTGIWRLRRATPR